MICLRPAAIVFTLLLVASSAHAQSALEWTSTGGPCGFFTLQIIPTSDGLLATGGQADGQTIYHSSDAGSNWTRRSAIDVPGFIIYGYAIAPSGAILVGGHGNNSGGLLFRSTDQGRTWEDLHLPGTSGAAVAVAANGTILAGGPSGSIYRSTDNGTSWKVLPIEGVLSGAMTILSNGTILAGGRSIGQHGIYRSSDNGATWTVALPMSSNTVATSIVETRLGSVAASIVSLGPDIVMRSSDNGEVWTTDELPADMGQIHTLLAVPLHDALYAGTIDGEVFRWSQASGEWERVADGLPRKSYIYSLAYIDDEVLGDRLLAATRLGPFRLGYDNQETEKWIPSCGGGYQAGTGSIAVSAAGNVLAAVKWASIYRSSNRGSEWLLGAVENDVVTSVAEAPDGSLLYGTLGSGLRRVMAGGDTSARIDRHFTGNAVSAVAAFGASELIAGTPGGAVYSSTNNGVDWRSVPTSTGEGTGGVTAIVPHGGKVYVAGTNGLFERIPNNPNLIRLPVPEVVQNFLGLSISPGGYMAVASEDLAMMSSDAGVIWKRLPPLPEGRSYSSIVIDREGKVYVVAKMPGSEYGRIYTTTRRETTWRDADRTGDSIAAYALALAPDGTLYASSATAVFRATLPSAVRSVPVGTDAGSITFTVAPTPAASSTTVRFTLRSAGEITYLLSDQTGREMIRRELGELPAGDHALHLDVTALAPGLYPCQVISGQLRAHGLVRIIR